MSSCLSLMATGHVRLLSAMTPHSEPATRRTPLSFQPQMDLKPGECSPSLSEYSPWSDVNQMPDSDVEGQPLIVTDRGIELALPVSSIMNTASLAIDFLGLSPCSVYVPTETEPSLCMILRPPQVPGGPLAENTHESQEWRSKLVCLRALSPAH